MDQEGLVLVNSWYCLNELYQILRLIEERRPELKRLILVSQVKDYYVDLAKARGCQGIIYKDIGLDDLAKKLDQALYQDQVFFPERESSNQLTPRRREITKLYAGSRSREDLAQDLSISLSSLAVSLSRIYAKLGVTSYQGLVKEAHDLGLVD